MVIFKITYIYYKFNKFSVHIYSLRLHGSFYLICAITK
jgi:hypothetical protein